MATRMAVNAVRKDKDSLKKPLTAKAVEEAKKKLADSKTFQKILNDPKKLEEMKTSALTGHGGAAELYVQIFITAAEGYNKNNPEWLSPKMPPLPKSFAESQEQLKATNARKPLNPALVEWHLAASIYMANAEENRQLNPLENMENRIKKVQNTETFKYMMKKQGPELMSNMVDTGKVSVISGFARAEQLRNIEKNKAELLDQWNKERQGNGPQKGGMAGAHA